MRNEPRSGWSARWPRCARSALLTGAFLIAQPLSAQSSFTDTVSSRLREFGVPGMTWALVRGDSTELGAAGVRDLGTGRVITPTTRMQVGSVTKTMLATGVLLLVTRGQLALDVPIATYLRDLPFDNAWVDTPITLRHLLDHTSGLGDAHLWQVFSQRTAPDLPLRDAMVRAGSRLRTQARPGTRFSYSNTGYLLLGALIEARTGERYETFLDRELLAPLGMTRSTFTWQSQVGIAPDTAMSMGHFEGGLRQPSYGLATRPAAQFATTAADMARFARFLMSDGRVQGRPLVDSVLLAGMARPTTTEAVHAGLQLGYAFGLQSRERWGVLTHCHTGNIGTFRALLCLVPDQQLALFAAYNSDPEEAPLDRIDSLLFARLGATRVPAAPVGRAAPDAAAWTGWYVQRPTRFEQFAYLDAVGSLVRVRVAEERITLAPLGGTARELEPHDERLWRVVGRQSPTHALLTHGGARSVSDGQRTLDRVPTALVWLRWAGAVLGVLSLLILLGRGLLRLVRPRAATRWRDPLLYAAVTLTAVLLAALALSRQPFLAIGDPTAASRALAVTTGALLLVTTSALVASALTWRRVSKTERLPHLTDLVLLSGAWQWLMTLAYWGLLPLLLWK